MPSRCRSAKISCQRSVELARVPSDDVRQHHRSSLSRNVNPADASAVISARGLGFGARREYCAEDKSGDGEGQGKNGELFHWINWRVAFSTEVLLNIRGNCAAPAALEN